MSASIRNLLLGLAASVVIAAMVWQGLAAHGNPDPTASHLTRAAAILDTGILVFREGLEAILVLAAITASLMRTQTSYWRPVAQGSGLAFLATLATWVVVVALISAVRAPEYDVQAATGLLAVIVLLVVMNWFFHRVYWTGWIAHHNRKKQDILALAQDAGGRLTPAVYRGLVLLGFSAMYREGFEIVLFLQSIRLQVGSGAVLWGALTGMGLTGLVAMLTFAAHRKLPYKKMLVLTGIMLGVVLVVMVGETVQEMQQAGWLSTTPIGVDFPGWINVWFATFPNIEGLTGQAFAALFVVGSYFAAEYLRVWKPRRQALAASNANGIHD
ncbi:hypothetical protein GCM10010885_05850 [Alicyclobacillus cellulosilyticus]|uniref:High-affinity iron transporter n=1 Tax=Alicyclobacillus cellulosilyticus TaxID=1003997 RepID=A0A917NGP4_9BACL|nr:iron permease [Alicyclobacillus cellulosilyticus]GGI99236.1 hypothetical protein GCM10010885_05850 [Alicyclobacillus cellulosilyticus]